VTETERADRAEALADEILGSFKQERLRAERAEAEVRRLREQIVNYGYDDDRALADRLAAAINAHLDDYRRCWDQGLAAALAAYEEARRGT
jgi:hypothetical protein